MPSVINFNDLAAKIQDRGIDTRATARELLSAWGFDLENRRPGIAYVDDSGQPVTTMDLACLLASLVDWGSVIDLPTYTAHGVATRKDGEVVLSKEHRHGKIIGMVGNAERFNFSIRIEDMNVMSAHSVGAYRNFLIMTDGVWHEGFTSLQFVPDREENKRLAKIAQANNVMTFEHFISPLRWTSVYGMPYLAAKLLGERLAEEKKWLDSEIKEVRAALMIESKSAYEPSEKVGDEKKIEVWANQVEVDGLKMSGKYDAVPRTAEALELAQTQRSRLNRYQEMLRFQTRASEYAFWARVVERYSENGLIPLCEGEVDSTKMPMASWAKTKSWTSTKATPRSKGWLTLSTAPGYTLRWRCWRKTATVAA